MAEWTSSELTRGVLTTMQGVLVHQRARWGALMGHQHQYEGWWKAEFRLALESWCWRSDLPEPTWVQSEKKPSNYWVGTTRESVDLLVGRWSEERAEILPGPRVWIEIKERGTWWGDARKGLGASNGGLRSDLMKWRDTRWADDDVVIACHVLSHDATRGISTPIPPAWAAVFEEVTAGFPRYLPTLSVCYPCVSPETGEAVDRYASIDFFTICQGMKESAVNDQGISNA